MSPILSFSVNHCFKNEMNRIIISYKNWYQIKIEHVLDVWGDFQVIIAGLLRFLNNTHLLQESSKLIGHFNKPTLLLMQLTNYNSGFDLKKINPLNWSALFIGQLLNLINTLFWEIFLSCPTDWYGEQMCCSYFCMGQLPSDQ